jgi:hypothetical protein
MPDDKQVREDLRYVRAVVDRAEGVDNPASIYFLWALISFFGYAIIDFEPEKTGFYWMIAGPVGGILSGVLGARSARRAGQISDRGGRSDFLHWTGLFGAIFLLIPLAAMQRLPTDDLPRVILLFVALAYWTAGVHVDRRMLPLGAVMGALYVFTLLAHELPYVWTLTATGLAASLAATGLFAAARERRSAGTPA